MQHPEPLSAAHIRLIKTALVLAGLLALFLFTLRRIPQLWGILFGGSVIAFLLTPLCSLFEKKLARPWAALCAILCVLGAVLLLIFTLLPLLASQFSAIGKMLPDALNRLKGASQDLMARLNSLFPKLQLPEMNFSAAQKSFGEFARNAAQTVSGVTDRAYRLFLSAALGYFFMVDRERLLLRLELGVPASWRRLAVRGGGMLARELRLYLRGQATIALAVGILAAAGLSIIGLPGAPLLAVIVGMFNVIPYFGPFLGGIPAVLLALGAGWQKALLTILILFLVQQIDGMVISPRVMGNITGFSPAVVLIALYIGGSLGSIAGMILALPVLMAARTLYRVFVQRHENN